MEISPLRKTVKILVAFAMMFPVVLCIGFASAQETDEKPGEESLFRFIEIGGVAEFTVSRKQSSEGETSTSTAAEQLEMGVGIEPHPWIGSEFGWIHEHEEDHGEEEVGHELGIFTGTIIVGPPDGNWWLKGGVQFLPFTMFELAEVHAAHDASIGPFETGAIVDPLSFEFGSKREKSLLLGVSLGEFLGSVYGYYGDDARSDEPRSGFGAAVGYKKHVDEKTKSPSTCRISMTWARWRVFRKNCSGMKAKRTAPTTVAYPPAVMIRCPDGRWLRPFTTAALRFPQST